MTRLGPYPNYKASGIEWVGSIPAHWQMVPMRHLVKIGTGSKDTVDADPDGAYPFIVRSPNAQRINTYTYDCEAVLTAGDGDVGKIFHHMTGKFDAHQRVYVLHDFKKVIPRYFYYFISEFFVNVAADGTAKSTVDSLRRPTFTNFPFVVPTEEEQSGIASFLDRETAQIDELIGKQERLIEVLAEKRHAIITNAVTKGLDSTAATKPSSVPWLGDVSGSWPVRPLKAAGEISLGKMVQPSPKAETDFKAPYLRAANVQPNGVLALGDVKKMWFNDSELRSLDVRTGDVLVVEGGIGGFGRAAYVDQDLPGFGYQNSINRIRPYESTDGRFLTYLLLTARHLGYIHAYCTGVSMPHLTAEKLAAITVPLPDRGIQTKISDHLDAELVKLNVLSDKASAVVNILQERRSALISAAVTGKVALNA